MAEFLLIDSEIALSFLQIAENSSNPAIRDRRLQAATKAYRAIIAFVPRVALTERDELKKVIDHIKQKSEPSEKDQS